MDLFDHCSVPISSLVKAVQHRTDQHPDQYVSHTSRKYLEIRWVSAPSASEAKPLARRPPSFCPKRPVAYAAHPKVDAELERLQNNGIILGLGSSSNSRRTHGGQHISTHVW